MVTFEYQKIIWKLQQIESGPSAHHTDMKWSKWVTPLIPTLDARWSECHVATQRLFGLETNSTYPISVETNWLPSQSESFVQSYNLCCTVRYETRISLGFQNHILGTITPPLPRFGEKRNIKYKTHRYVHKIWLYDLNLVKNDLSTVNFFFSLA